MASNKEKEPGVADEHRSNRGGNQDGWDRILRIQKMIRSWDGRTWFVKHEKSFVVFSVKNGPGLHVVPRVSAGIHTDWLSLWVNLNDDSNFVVTSDACSKKIWNTPIIGEGK